MGAASSSPPALLPIDEALAVVLGTARPLGAVQVPLSRAAGRFVVAPVAAALDLPPFTNSAMDGYAVRAADTPGRLVVIGESAAGAPFTGAVAAGEAVAISTGAVLPGGADAVVPIEHVTTIDGGIELRDALAPGSDVRQRGGDIAAGTTVLHPGVRIGAAQIGAAAAAGLRELPVSRLPRVAILTTGSELVAPGEPLADGQIYDANQPMLSVALHEAGAAVELIPAAADSVEAHRELLARALECDVVISSGGVSVGPHDLVRAVGRELGVRELFWRVALRPGKPLSFGVRDRTLVFGLPGNPVSTLVCFALFVRPALLALQGARDPRPDWMNAELASAITRNPERDDLIRVRRDERGRLLPLPGQQSHQIAVTAQADGLARIPTGTGELAAGTEVAYLPLHQSR